MSGSDGPAALRLGEPPDHESPVGWGSGTAGTTDSGDSGPFDTTAAGPRQKGGLFEPSCPVTIALQPNSHGVARSKSSGNSTLPGRSCFGRPAELIGVRRNRIERVIRVAVVGWPLADLQRGRLEAGRPQSATRWAASNNASAPHAPSSKSAFAEMLESRDREPAPPDATPDLRAALTG